MTTTQASRAGFQPNSRLLIAGSVLMGAGALIGLTGFAISGSALLSAARRWINDMEQPPSSLARQKWAQAKAATAAGASAWHDSHPASTRAE